MFSDLFLSILEKYQEMQTHEEFTCFRGAPITKEEIKKLKKDHFVELEGFVSTSKNQDVVF